jgi:hypothetical protein
MCRNMKKQCKHCEETGYDDEDDDDDGDDDHYDNMITKSYDHKWKSRSEPNIFWQDECPTAKYELVYCFEYEMNRTTLMFTKHTGR